MKTILAIIVVFIAAAATLSLTTFDTFTSAVTQQQNFIAQLNKAGANKRAGFIEAPDITPKRRYLNQSYLL
jgi:hypothetical protein